MRIAIPVFFLEMGLEQPSSNMIPKARALKVLFLEVKGPGVSMYTALDLLPLLRVCPLKGKARFIKMDAKCTNGLFVWYLMASHAYLRLQKLGLKRLTGSYLIAPILR
ncbi:hypothetical protein D3C72_1285760 [compost metagenome]